MPSLWARALGEPLFLIALLSFAWRLREEHFMGVVGPDNFGYLQLANSIMRGTSIFALDTTPFHVGRLGMTLPLALSLSLFGVSEATAALWPMLCGVGSVAVAYALGRHLAGLTGAVAAAFVLAVYPLEVLYSTTPLPDTVASFFLGLTVLLFLVGLEERRALALIGCGAALGAAYWARLNAPVAVLVLAWALLLRAVTAGELTPGHLLRDAWRLAWVAVGAAVVLAGGVAFEVALGASPGFELAQYGPLAQMNAGMVASRGGRDPLLHFAGQLWLSPMLHGWTLIAIACTFGLVLARDRRVLLPLGWAAVWYFYLEVGSQYPAVSLVQKEMRYLTPLAIPLALLVALAAARIVEAARAVRSAWLLVGVAAASVAYVVEHGLPTARAFALHQRTLESQVPRETFAALRTLPDLPLYTTVNWLGYLNFYGGFRYGLDLYDPATFATARLRKAQLDPASRPVGVARGLVVHDETYGLNVPPTWTLLLRTDWKVAVYYAPDPTPPEPHEPRFGFDLAAAPRLRIGAAGATRDSVALDWLLEAQPPPSRVTLTGRDAGGGVVARTEAPLDGGRALPTPLWPAGSLQRVYYGLPGAGSAATVDVAVDGGAPVALGRVGRPNVELLVEPELFEGVLADQDRALAALTGWGSYSQPPYGGGKAAIARVVGSRAVGRLARPIPAGSHRLWLRVYSYGADTNRVELLLNEQAGEAAWRSGAPGIGWVAVDFPSNPGGDRVELVTRAVGQSFAIVDQIAIER